MANYTIDWQSNNAEGIPGKAPISLPEKTLNSSSTSLTLTGKGVNNYGEIQQENFIRLMESFASGTAPLHPTVGQIWFDKTNNVPKVYDVSQIWIPLIVGNAGGYITLVGDPVTPLNPVTKQYVDTLISGLLPQTPVVAATTGPITLSGLQTIDGVAVVAGERVLVKDQASLIANGVYVAAVGAWARSAEFDGTPSTEVINGMSFPVVSGILNAGKRFAVSTPNPITIGVSNITFNEVIDYTAYTNVSNTFVPTQNFSAGLTSTGTTFADGSLVQKSIDLGAGSGARTINLALGDIFKLGVDAPVAPATVLSFTNPQPAPRSHVFLLEITNGGSNTVQWPASVAWNAGSAPTLKLSGVDVLGFTTVDGGVTYRGVIIAGGTGILPIASASVLGGIKIGAGLSIDGAGVVSAAGLGNNLTLVGNTYIDGALQEKSNTLANATGARTVDLNLGDYVYATITGNCSFSFTNPAVAGRVSAFVMELTNPGSATITWPASVQWVGGTAPTLRASGKNVIGFFTKDAGTYYCAFLIA